MFSINWKQLLLWSLLLIYPEKTTEQFSVPDVTFKAYDPTGLKVSIPALEGIQLVAFHINLNRKISPLEPGEITVDLTKLKGNKWSHIFPNVSLKIGDTLHYWVYVQYDFNGYQTDSLQMEITELLRNPNTGFCNPSTTAIWNHPNSVCSGDVIFEDNFNKNWIVQSKWLIEEYIPSMGPDYEFVSYQNDEEVCFVGSMTRRNNRLFIKPKVLIAEDQVRGILDLQDRCTRSRLEECKMESHGAFILPPIISGRMIAKLRFRYGIIEIKAKLPAGNWIYPQMYLESLKAPNKKLWLAYARGNGHLLGHNGVDDIGGRCLFAGPVLAAAEPQRSQYLRTKKADAPFSRTEHIFKVIWRPDEIQIFCDDLLYGYVDNNQMRMIDLLKDTGEGKDDKKHNSDDSFVQLVLGVGVGGINDFPDGYTTDYGVPKPWQNRERTQMKKFFQSRNQWLKTWHGNDTALHVDYVRITAL